MPSSVSCQRLNKVDNKMSSWKHAYEINKEQLNNIRNRYYRCEIIIGILRLQRFVLFNSDGGDLEELTLSFSAEACRV